MRLLVFLFFLPIIESFNRDFGFTYLFLLTVIIGIKLCRKNLHFDTISLLFLGLIGIFTLTLPFSISVLQNMKELARYMSYFIIFQYVKEQILSGNFSLKVYLSIIILDAVILTLLWGVYSLSIFQLTAPLNTMNLFYPNFGHNRIALLYLFTLPITIIFSLSIRNHLRQLLFFLFSLLTLFFLLLTNARGVLVSLGIAVFLTIFLIRKKQLQSDVFDYTKQISRWGVALIVMAIIFLLSSFIFSNLIIPYDQSSYGYQHWKGFYKPIINEYRFEYLRQAWEGFSLSPIIGTGLGTFRYISLMFQIAPDRWSWYVHNQYAELFMETGIIGGTIFVLFLLLILSRIIKVVLKKTIFPLEITLIIPVFAVLIHSLLDYDLHYLSIFLFFWISVAYLTVNKEEKGVAFKRFIIPGILILFSSVVVMVLTISQVEQLFIEKNDSQEVKMNVKYNYLLWLHNLDRTNTDITSFLGRTAQVNGNYENAHMWYKQTFILQPFYQRDSLKQDLYLYLEETEGTLRNLMDEEAQTKLMTVKYLYPSFQSLQLVNIESLSSSELLSLIAKIKKDSLQWYPSNSDIIDSVERNYALKSKTFLWQ